MRLEKLQALRELRARAATTTGGSHAEARAQLLAECPTADALAERFDPTIVRTPAVRLVGRRLLEATSASDGRLVISVPPQELKTTELRWLCTLLLFDDPNRRIIYASYAASLARQSGRAVRGNVEEFGAAYGLTLDRSASDASDWALAGHRGGMVAVGVGGALTGRAGDVLIIDDPVRNQQDADSETLRETLREWYRAVGRTRLAPGSPIIEVQTRWNEDDLAGDLIAEGWPLVNVPALADGETRDDLGREPGTYLQSTRGRTPEDWQAIRRDVGERVWASLYQGRPAPLEGGIFQKAWVEDHRVTALPERVEQTVVAVDPAETGMGDAAGILVGHRGADGHTYTTADLSGQLTQAGWGRVVCLTAVRVDAASIVQERNLGMSRTLTDAWVLLRRQAVALQRASGDDVERVASALATLRAAGDTVAADEAGLREVLPWVVTILERPSVQPCRISMIHPRVSKQARAEGITGYYELGVTHHVGRLPQLEHEMFTWQPGQPSPNRLDTLALLLTQLDSYRAQTRRRRDVAPMRVPASTAGTRPALSSVPMRTGGQPRG